MKRNSWLICASLLMSLVQINVYADYCFMPGGLAGFCNFENLSSKSSPHSYFHCEANNAWYVKMYTHHVLVGGFMPGAGTLTLTGSEVQRVLNNYYFEVAHHEGHDGMRYVGFTSLGSFQCSLGTGGRSAVFPGAFAVKPAAL